MSLLSFIVYIYIYIYITNNLTSLFSCQIYNILNDCVEIFSQISIFFTFFYFRISLLIQYVPCRFFVIIWNLLQFLCENCLRLNFFSECHVFLFKCFIFVAICFINVFFHISFPSLSDHKGRIQMLKVKVTVILSYCHIFLQCAILKKYIFKMSHYIDFIQSD